MVKSIILIGFWMFVIPIILGLGILKLDKKGNKNVCLSLILGLFVELLFFSCLAIPMTFLRCSFTLLKNTWAIMMIILSIVSILFNRKNIKDIVKQNVDEVKGLPKILTVIFLILLVLQCYYPFKYMHEDYDDSNFVAKAVIAVDTDTLFVYDDAGYEYKEFPIRTVLSQFPHYTGTIAVLSDIHPTVLAHTILPVVFIIMVYSFYYVFGKSLFKNDQKKAMIFLNLLAVIYIFGDYSRYTTFVRLLYRTWQGKSLLANLTIPFVWYVFIEYIGKENSKFGWSVLGLCLAGSITFSSMAFILLPIMVAILMLLYAIKDNKKRNIVIMSIIFLLVIVLVGIYSIINVSTVNGGAVLSEELGLVDKIKIFISEVKSETNLNLVKESYDRAGGGKFYFSLFTISILFIVLDKKNENKDIFFSFTIYSVIVLIINLNPIFSKIWSIIVENGVHWRIYWLLPIGYVVAYVITKIIVSNEKNKTQILIGILSVSILILNGKWVFTKLNYVEVDNYYKIPDHLLEMIYIIQSDGDGIKKVGGPEELIVYARQISGNIITETTRNVSGYYLENSLVKLIPLNDLEKVYNMIIYNECEYVVMYTHLLRENDIMIKMGLKELCRNDSYILYKIDNK